MLFYWLLCTISTFTGLGVIRLVKLPISTQHAIFLAPTITLSIWSIALALGILWHFTVKQLAIPYWIITLGLSIYAIHSKNGFAIKQNYFYILLTILLPMLIMAPYIFHGLTTYPGAPAPDGWSYIAYGQYVWENSRSVHIGLSPLHQYSMHLNSARFISSALLGFFSVLTLSPGDTQTSSNLLQIWSLFTYCSACTCFAMTQLSKRTIPIYLLIVMYSGWILGLIELNNFDNGLVIAYLPIFAAISTVYTKPKWSWAIIISLLISAILYCYIELAPMILIGIFILCYQRIDIRSKSHWLFLSGIILMTVLLVYPYGTEMLNFLKGQLHAAASIQRPGEGTFRHLVDQNRWRMLSEFWGFHHIKTLSIVTSILISILFLMGFWQLIKNKYHALVTTCLVSIVVILYMIFYAHYSYGAYKLILLNEWLIAFIVLMGARAYQTSYVIVPLVAVYLFLNSFYAISITKQVIANDITDFKKLSTIKSITKNKAIQVSVDNGFNNEWAVYYLRDLPIVITDYRLYMAQAHVLPYMKQARVIQPSDIGYVLTDSRDSFPKQPWVWHSGPYYLWAKT